MRKKQSQSVDCEAPGSDEALFSHMQELLDILPEMQEKGTIFHLALEARELYKLKSRYDSERSFLEEAEEEMRQANSAASEDWAKGDKERSLQHQRIATYHEAMRGFRIGPCQNSQIAYEKTLAESPFSDEEDWLVALLSEEEFSSLDDQIKAYQEDYAQTLEACQRLIKEP